MVPALWVRPGQGYLDTVVGTSYCTVEAVLIEHWPLCRVNGRYLTGTIPVLTPAGPADHAAPRVGVPR
jgi:hypothetical protein